MAKPAVATVRQTNHPIHNDRLYCYMVHYGPADILYIGHLRQLQQPAGVAVLLVGKGAGFIIILNRLRKRSTAVSTRFEAYYNFFRNTFFMGHHKLHQRHFSNKFNISSIPVHGINNPIVLGLYKRMAKMAEVKMLVMLSNIIGIPLSVYTMFINFHTWKSDVLFVLTGLYLVAKFYFYVRKSIQEEKSRSLKLRKEEHDILEEIED